jgi:hypothetical protein
MAARGSGTRRAAGSARDGAAGGRDLPAAGGRDLERAMAPGTAAPAPTGADRTAGFSAASRMPPPRLEGDLLTAQQYMCGTRRREARIEGEGGGRDAEAGGWACPWRGRQSRRP